MLDVRLLTFAVAGYGLSVGLMLNATPQAVLALGLGSRELGLICAANPVGYVVACLGLGRVCRGVPGKYVLLAGTAGAGASMLMMAGARTTGGCAAAQFLHGFSSGAFWPFASAWLMDFQREGLSRTRLLRRYNVAWCSGIAAGQYAGGLLCARGWIAGALHAGAGVAGGMAALAALAKATQPVRAPLPDAAPRPAAVPDRSPERAPVPYAVRLLAVAILANVAAVSARAVLLNNYAELNQRLGFRADRMGLFAAAGVLTQLVAFGFSGLFEPRLGRRRTYAAMAAALGGVLCAFACSASLWVLVPAVVLHGLVLAMAFQTSMLTATAHFASPRTGTTVHEAAVGAAALASFGAGWVTERLQVRGVEPLTALRAPLVMLVAGVGIVLLVQLVLIRRRAGGRVAPVGAVPAAPPKGVV